MTADSAGLERRYRRLLAWYPPRFRAERGDEMLAVLLASAREGQRRPSVLDAVDVLKSSLRIRLRYLRSGPGNQAWAGNLAVFAVLAPLFLLVAALLEAFVPYHVSLRPGFPSMAKLLGRHPQIGGLSLFSLPGFDIAVGSVAVIAALALLGLRRLALAAITAAAISLIAARGWIPGPLQLLLISVGLLEAAALIATPEPRRGRHLMDWGHVVVLMITAAAVQVATLLYDATTSFQFFGRPPKLVYLVIILVLAAVAVGLALALRSTRHFLLLLLAVVYPFVVQLAVPGNSSSGDLIGSPTPLHLVILFVPPLLLALSTIITAVMPPRPGALAPPAQPS
ncbi:MAG: hypothetical protein ACRDNF_03715 [Streptosporangiaceae bacterium]